MSQPFLGEVKIVPYNFAQKGWAFCNGQLLPIAQNQALFSLLGTTYGGDGQTTFALPNLAGRTPLHWGTGPSLPAVTLGQSGGEAMHTLNTNEMASHTHPFFGSSTQADNTAPDGALVAATGQSSPTYLQSSANSTLGAGSIGPNGGGQSHNNMQPYLALNFVIALQGIYPSRS